MKRIFLALFLLGGLSLAATVARPAAASHLQAPQLQAAVPISSSSIRLTWQDTNTAPLTGFRVVKQRLEGGTTNLAFETIVARKDANGISTYDVTGLTLGQTYCFAVRAMAPHPNPEAVTADESAESNTRCVTLESPYVRTLPRTCPGCAVATAPPPAQTKTKLPSDLIAQPNAGPPAPTKPDLAAVRVIGPATLRQGISQTYTAEITNEGRDATGTVALTIIFYGALEPGFQTLFFAEAGLYCERDAATAAGTTGVIRCLGGTLTQGQTATVTFQARAAKAGQGNIVAEINPNRTLEESDYSNNRAPAIRVDVSG